MQPRGEGLWGRIPGSLQRSLAIVGLVAGPVTVVLGTRDLLGLEGPGWAKILAWSGSGLLLAAISTVYVQQVRHDAARQAQAERHHSLLITQDRDHQEELDRFRRNTRVAVALPDIHLAFHLVRDAAVMIRSGDSEFAYGPVIVRSLSHFSQAFGAITGAPCRLCVKRLTATHDAPAEVQPDDVRYLHVTTLWRHESAGVDPARDMPSPLHANTDFQGVWRRATTDPRCFFANDLDALPSYSNPHRTGDPATFDYNAAMVWPIQREATIVGVLGFLCVDSKQKGIFEFQPDFDLGATYADTLYTVLMLREPLPASAIGDLSELGAVDV